MLTFIALCFTFQEALMNSFWHVSPPVYLILWAVWDVRICSPMFRNADFHVFRFRHFRVLFWHAFLPGVGVIFSVTDSLPLSSYIQRQLVPSLRVMCIYIYTGCHRRNGPNFGRVFLMLNYTDITKNTYIQSWTVTEIIAREVWNFDSCYTLTDCQIHIETGRNM